MPKAMRVVVQQTNLHDIMDPPIFYRFTLPASGEKDFYRITNSFNAFFHGNRKSGVRWNWSNIRLLSADFEHPKLDGLSVNASVYKKMDPHNFKITDIAGLYEFYEHIGWDRRNKRYLNPAEYPTKETIQ